MKRLATLLALSISFLAFALISSSSVSSQTPATDSANLEDETLDFDKAYAEYVAKLEEYNDAHEEYLLRRSQYLRFMSLKSQQDAREATVKMLKSRDDVVISYLTAVKVRLLAAIGVPDARRESLSLLLEDEIAWFVNHRDTVPSAGTLEDLVKDSDEASKRWEAVKSLVYETLSTISMGKISDFTERTENSLASVKNKVEAIKKETDEEKRFSSQKLDTLDRWIFETDARIIRSKEKMVEAEGEMALFAKQRKDLLGSYNQVLETLGEAQLFLKEAATFLKEVIREIKTAE